MTPASNTSARGAENGPCNAVTKNKLSRRLVQQSLNLGGYRRIFRPVQSDRSAVVHITDDAAAIDQKTRAGVLAIFVTAQPPLFDCGPIGIDGDGKSITKLFGIFGDLCRLERRFIFMMVCADH